MIEQAARWAAMLDAGDMSRDDRRACDEWSAAHPLHKRTLDRMRAFDARVVAADTLGRDALRSVLERRQYRRVGGILMGVALLAVAGWTGSQSDFIRDRLPDYYTGRGEIRTVALDDESEITIDTDSAVSVHMRGRQREVRLTRGQLLARVAKDRTRPFVVETAHGAATALGTRFIVRREDSYTLVAVIESRVRICPARATGETACRTLVAGERARITPSAIAMLSPVEPSAASMWSSGWLEADDQEVSEVLAELRRYSDRQIRFDAASLRGVKVTGSFPLRDIDRAMDGIGRAAALQIRRSSDGEIIVAR